jgi:hypothetical protein
MANVARPVGLRPSRYMNGAPFNGQSQLYYFSAADATNPAFKGDLVKIDSTNRSNGITDPYSSGVPAVVAVAAALTTNSFRGVIAGFLPQPEFSQSVTATLGLQYRQASTARYCWVIDDPMVVFQAQEIVANSYTSASANGIWKTCDLSYVAGNTTTGISKSGVTGFQNTGATVRPLRALRMSAVVDNFNFSSSDAIPYTWWDLINNNTDLAQKSDGL